MGSGAGHTTCLVRGSPIRKSSDQRSVDSSPRLIAASYVLHRLLVPRHPPCALKNLATQKSHPSTPGRTSMSGPTQTLLLQSQKMLASTVQFSTYNQTPATRPHQTQHAPRDTWRYEIQTGPDTRSQNTPAGMARSLRTQQRAYDPAPRRLRSTPTKVSSTRSRPQPAAELVSVPPSSTTPHALRPSVTGRPSWCGRGSAPPARRLGGEVLLRKEVIQPPLPVRLPCYDFVPIADPAFDGSLHKGWATGFGRYRLS